MDSNAQDAHRGFRPASSLSGLIAIIKGPLKINAVGWVAVGIFIGNRPQNIVDVNIVSIIESDS